MSERIIAGRYSLEAEAGRGGMGAVWRGTDTVLGRTVALKRIGVAPGGATADTVRAEREARLAARLNDPHVVAVYDLVVEAGEQWLVMEYVDGTDLAGLIRSEGALSPDRVAPILAQTASALAAAHASGIVHRDVKPSNILVTSDGQVKLSDFGIARTQADAALTQTGLVTGSPAYLSPEVASGRQATPASDVWSLGATLVHALEGHPPYDLGDNVIGGLYRIVHEAPPRPSHPGWLAPLPSGTMTADPAHRWTAAQVQAFLEGGATSTPPPVATVRVRPATLVDTAEDTPVSPAPGSSPDAVGTQVLTAGPAGPAGIAPVPPPPPRPGHRGAPGAPRARRRPAGWVLALVAVLVVALGAVALVVGLGRGGSSPSADPTSTGPSDSASSPSSSPSAATADGMRTFLKQYLQEASTDPGQAFGLLTPAYQQQSGGESGYRSFWGKVTSATLVEADPDPSSLVIDYTYRYQRGRQTTTERLAMQLEYADGRYLIDGQTKG